MAELPKPTKHTFSVEVPVSFTITRSPWDHNETAEGYAIWYGETTVFNSLPAFTVLLTPAKDGEAPQVEVVDRNGQDVGLYLRHIIWEACRKYEAEYQTDHERYVRERNAYMLEHDPELYERLAQEPGRLSRI